MPSLTPQEVRQILEALDASGWDEAIVTVGDVSISVARDGATVTAATPGASLAPRDVAAPPASNPPMYPPGERSVAPSPALVPSAAPSGSAAAGDVEVLSPTVGMFWRSPQPGAPPFVEVGQTVERGDILCSVEVMKLMNNVISEVAGRVTAILVGNGGAVEHGQVLMTITPANG